MENNTRGRRWGFIEVGFRVRQGNQTPRIRFGEGPFPTRARQGGRRRVDVWGQCGRERRDGACSPARERKGRSGISAVWADSWAEAGGKGKQAEGGGAGWAACCGSAGFFFSILFFQSLFRKRILNAKTNKIKTETTHKNTML